MSYTVRKATIDLFGQIYPLLQHFRAPSLPREQWHELLSIRWSKHHAHFGYVLMADDRVAGFLGTLFFERVINGTEHRFCNLFCWIVAEEHRQHSLLLLFPALKLRDTTVMSMTPSKDAGMILEKFGFTALERRSVIYPVFTVPGRSRGIRLVSEHDRIRSLLNPEDLVLFRDHSRYDHLLIVETGGEGNYCYLVSNTVRKKGLRFTHIYHLGNPALFRQGFSRVQWLFLRRNHTFFTLVDHRLLGGIRPGPGFTHILRYPRLYRSPDLRPEQIDNLYSELLLLEL